MSLRPFKEMNPLPFLLCVCVRYFFLLPHTLPCAGCLVAIQAETGIYVRRLMQQKFVAERKRSQLEGGKAGEEGGT